MRCGIGAEEVQRIWSLGLHTTQLAVLRDCAACVFAYAFNGLRDSSIMTILADKVFFRQSSMFARVSMVKGRAASKEQLVSYHRNGALQSPVDLIERWKRKRLHHPRFFALDEEAVPYGG